MTLSPQCEIYACFITRRSSTRAILKSIHSWQTWLLSKKWWWLSVFWWPQLLNQKKRNRFVDTFWFGLLASMLLTISSLQAERKREQHWWNSWEMRLVTVLTGLAGFFTDFMTICLICCWICCGFNRVWFGSVAVGCYAWGEMMWSRYNGFLSGVDNTPPY